METVNLIQGGSHIDSRGSLMFVNGFEFANIKRFYQITQTDKDIVRAWQGHKLEKKYFFVGKGAFVIAWVEIDNWENPSKSLQPSHTILSQNNPQVLQIPPGYANGIKALEAGSILTVYSNMSLEESAADRISFDKELWFDWGLNDNG